MIAEREGSFIAPVYHNIYNFMQDRKLFGAWQRTAHQHERAIKEHLGSREKISVLYCGTATSKNPCAVNRTIQNLGLQASITTMDLSGKPLLDLNKGVYEPVQANSASLPYAERSFDYITTDFLLSKMMPSTIISTIQEWGRVLKDDGLITMTTGVKIPDANPAEHIYDQITNGLYGIHFLSMEVLRQIFYSAGLELKSEQAQFDVKPFMYRYPDNLLVFAVARPVQPESSELAKTARVFIKDTLSIKAATYSDVHLRPLGIEETIDGLMGKNFITLREEGGQMFGFIRVQKLTNNWFEIGSLYIEPFHRKTAQHYGSGLLLRALNVIKKRDGKVIVFSDNHIVTRTLEEAGAIKQKMVPMELLLPLLKNRIGSRETSKDFVAKTLSLQNRKSIYTLSFR